MNSSPLGFIRTKLSQLEKDIIFEKKDTTALTQYLRNKTDDPSQAANEGYTQEQFLNELAKYQPTGEYVERKNVPTKLSQLTINDAEFVKVSVDNLANYHLASELMTQEQFQQAIDEFLVGLSITPVESIEAIDVHDPLATRTIFLVPDAKAGDDAYNEYIVIKEADGTYKKELLGKTNIDLSLYAKKSEVDALGYAQESDIKPIAKSGEYSDLDPTSLPDIPDAVADLTDADSLVKKKQLEDAANQRGNKKLKRVYEQTIKANSWISDPQPPLPEYKFKGEILVEGINGTDWKVTDFFSDALFEDKLCPIVETAEGKVYFWAKSNLQEDIIVKSLDVVAVNKTRIELVPNIQLITHFSDLHIEEAHIMEPKDLYMKGETVYIEVETKNGYIPRLQICKNAIDHNVRLMPSYHSETDTLGFVMSVTLTGGICELELTTEIIDFVYSKNINHYPTGTVMYGGSFETTSHQLIKMPDTNYNNYPNSITNFTDNIVFKDQRVAGAEGSDYLVSWRLINLSTSSKKGIDIDNRNYTKALICDKCILNNIPLDAVYDLGQVKSIKINASIGSGLCFTSINSNVWNILGGLLPKLNDTHLHYEKCETIDRCTSYNTSMFSNFNTIAGYNMTFKLKTVPGMSIKGISFGYRPMILIP